MNLSSKFGTFFSETSETSETSKNAADREELRAERAEGGEGDGGEGGGGGRTIAACVSPSIRDGHVHSYHTTTSHVFY